MRVTVLQNLQCASRPHVKFKAFQTYRAIHATNQPNWKEEGKTFIYPNGKDGKPMGDGNELLVSRKAGECTSPILTGPR